MSRILYKEHIIECAEMPRREYVTDYVEVQVRCWTAETMISDVVIEERVMVDRELIINKRTAYEHNKAEAYFIRLGIAKFDELLAAHPTLAPQQEE